MATSATPNAADKSSKSAKTVDAAFWWESFGELLTELVNDSVVSELPQSLEKKLKDNHMLFLHTIALFKSPDQKSREALDSSRVKIGDHELNAQSELKETAHKISSILCLDEVQSCILIKRSLERTNSAVNDLQPDIINLVMLDYYIERQCLLKCTRQILIQILMHACMPQDSTAGTPLLKKLSTTCLSIGPALRAVASMSREDWANKLVHCKNKFVSTCQHCWLSSKLLWADLRISSSLLLKLAGGKSLSRRERQQLKRTIADVFKLVLLAVFIMVPFMEFLLPVLLKLCPNLLPSTFHDNMKEEIQLYNSMVDKDGTGGEVEAMKAYKAAHDGIEDGAEVPERNRVSSALIDRVDAMLQNLEKVIDDVDAKIGDHSWILDRYLVYDCLKSRNLDPNPQQNPLNLTQWIHLPM